MSFPTPRGGGGSKSVNPAAYFAPGIVGALTEKFLPKPAAKPTKVTGDALTDETLLLADELYGADREDPTFLQNLLPSLIDAGVAAGFGDEGGAQYAQTAINRQIANRSGARDIASAKAQYVKENSKKTYTPLLMQNTKSAALGIPDKVAGFAVKTGRNAWYEIPDGKGGYMRASKDWVQHRSDAPDMVATLRDPDFVELNKLDNEQIIKDDNTMNVLRTMNNVVETLDEADPLTVTSTVVNFGNDAYANFKQASNLIQGTTERKSAFSQGADDETGGSYGREGTGKYAELLQAALDTEDPQKIEAALAKWEEAYAGTEQSLSKVFKNISFDKADTASSMLKIGYMLAAANGQTGRTLSDKDLAFHLQMIGYGATQDSEVAKAMLLKVGDSLIEGIDTGTQMKFNPSRIGRMPKANTDRYKLLFGNYFTTSKKVGDDGKETAENDWTNISAWVPRSYGERYAYVKDVNKENFYQKWISHRSDLYTDRYDMSGVLAPTEPLTSAQKAVLSYDSIMEELK
tara:strand:- start:324 stop:1877 length:1554 start_codon:yes stop_codon:yes gene_type:complete